MTRPALAGDIGGTNSRFGFVDPGTAAISGIERLRNDDHASLEAAVQAYLKMKGVKDVSALAIAVAGPVTREPVSLTNRPWTFTRASLAKAANAANIRLLNDFEALALSLPLLGPEDLHQIGGETPTKPGVKLVLGPGTGLGMATLAPLPGGGWLPLAGELGHITLPVETQAEFNWRERMTLPGVIFESEDALTGPGLLRMYRAIGGTAQTTPEEVRVAALAATDTIAVATLEQFVVWLARIAGDAAMTMQAYGGVYLAGGIAPTILPKLDAGPFRETFQEKGRLAHFMRPIPVYVIVDTFPALKGCAAAIQSGRFD